MKEIEKKDAPEVSGGQTIPVNGWLPIMPVPGYPQMPGIPRDPLDPLGDGTNHVQS